jgi:coronin-1B/1C/6
LQSDSFQSDIFPLAPSAEPSLGASEFFNGTSDIKAKMVNLENGSGTTSSKPSAYQSQPTKAASAPAPAPAPAASIPEPEPPKPVVRAESYSAPTPTSAVEPPSAHRASPMAVDSGPDSSALQEENARLNNELREARAQIRNLELQVESMKANAQRAAKALLEGGGV